MAQGSVIAMFEVSTAGIPDLLGLWVSTLSARSAVQDYLSYCAFIAASLNGSPVRSRVQMRVYVSAP